MLETLDYTIRIGSTPTFLYFDLYLYSAYAAHFVNFIVKLLDVLDSSDILDNWRTVRIVLLLEAIWCIG